MRRKVIISSALGLLSFSGLSPAGDYVVYIRDVSSRQIGRTGVIEFKNLSVNLPLLLNALIGAGAFPPSAINFIKLLNFHKISPLNVGSIEIKLTPNGRTITISEAENNSIKWQSVVIKNSQNETSVTVNNLSLSSPVFNRYNIPPIKVKKIVILQKNGGLTVNIEKVLTFKGNIDKIKISIAKGNYIAAVENLRNLDLKEVLKAVNYFVKLPLKLEGILSIKKVVYSDGKVILKGLTLDQGLGGINLSSLSFTHGKGLKIRGDLEDFTFSVENVGSFSLSGSFSPDRFSGNRYSLDFESPFVNLHSGGSVSFKNRFFRLVADELNLSLKSRKEKKRGERKGEGFNPENVVVRFPSLPFNLEVWIKRLKVKTDLNVPHVKLRPLEVSDIKFSYEGGIYSAHAAVCYTDLFLTSTANGTLSFSVVTLDNPLSALLGCFVEDIDIPVLKKTFFSGRLNLMVGGVLPKGKLSDFRGFADISLLGGNLYVRRDFQLEGFLGRVYSGVLKLFDLLGVLGFDVEYPVLNYNLYTGGSFGFFGKTFKTRMNTYLFVEKPLAVKFGGFASGIYTLPTGVGALNIRGVTRFPLKNLEILRHLPLGVKRK